MLGGVLEIDEEFRGVIFSSSTNGRPDREGGEDEGGFPEADQFESEDAGDSWGGRERLQEMHSNNQWQMEDLLIGVG